MHAAAPTVTPATTATASAAHRASSALRARAPGQASAVPSCAELVSHRDYLVRFALRQLRDLSQAEDVVQDVFEAVLSRKARFAGRAALRTWLTGVLKHKIIDQLRQRRAVVSLDDDGDDEHAALSVPCSQPRPDEIAEQRERLQRTLARIEALPPGLRAVMQLRVLDGQPSAQVCASLRISEDNLFVRLHRARKQLM